MSLPTMKLHFSSTPRSRIRWISASSTSRGQAVARDAIAQHAAGLAEGLEDRHRIAAPRKLVGAGEARRTGADHGHFLRALLLGELGELQVLGDAEVADETLQRVDRDGTFLGRAVAGLFAGMRADPPADRRKRIALDDLLPGDLEGLLVGPAVGFGLGDGGEPAADIGAAGAVPDARRRLRGIPGRSGLISAPAAPPP